MTLGSPPQSFQLIFDTGSSWMWVTSVACANCAADSFDPAASTTYSTQNEEKHLYYGQGDCSGVVAYDTAGIGITGEAPVANQAFILVDQENDFGGTGFDGILVSSRQGLAFESLSDKEETFVGNLFKAGLIPAKMFSVYLSSTIANGTDNNSVIIFGGGDPQAYSETNQINKVAVTNSGYWSVAMSQVTVNNKPLSIEAGNAIIDTGTSLFAVYNKDFKELVSKLVDGFQNCGQTQEGLVGCECEAASDFPSFNVTLGSYSFEVLPEYYIMEQDNDGSLYCFLLIQPIDFQLPGGKGAWILGDVFIRGYYMEFDMDNMTIGIAGGVSSDYKPHSSSSSSFPVWGIVLIVIACLAVVGTAGVLLFLCNRKRRRAQKSEYVQLQPGQLQAY